MVHARWRHLHSLDKNGAQTGGMKPKERTCFRLPQLTSLLPLVLADGLDLVVFAFSEPLPPPHEGGGLSGPRSLPSQVLMAGLDLRGDFYSTTALGTPSCPPVLSSQEGVLWTIWTRNWRRGISKEGAEQESVCVWRGPGKDVKCQ